MAIHTMILSTLITRNTGDFIKVGVQIAKPFGLILST